LRARSSPSTSVPSGSRALLWIGVPVRKMLCYAGVQLAEEGKFNMGSSVQHTTVMHMRVQA
jgi:hypothetical protein